MHFMEKLEDIPHADWIIEQIEASKNSKVLIDNPYHLQIMVDHTRFEIWYDHGYRYKENAKPSGAATTRNELLRCLGVK